MNHGGDISPPSTLSIIPHQPAFIFRADSLAGWDLPVQIWLNRKRQGTHNGAEPPSSSSHPGEHRKKKQNTVREEDIQSDLCLPIKQWELHSRQPFHHQLKLGRVELLQ